MSTLPRSKCLLANSSSVYEAVRWTQQPRGDLALSSFGTGVYTRSSPRVRTKIGILRVGGVAAQSVQWWGMSRSRCTRQSRVRDSSSDYVTTYRSLFCPMALDGQEILYFMSVGVASTQSFEVRRSPLPLSLLHPPKGTPHPGLSHRIPGHSKTARPVSPVPRHPQRPRSPRPRPALRPHRRPRPRRHPQRHEHRQRPSRPPRKPRVPPDQIHRRLGAFRVPRRPDALQSLFTRGWFPSPNDRRDHHHHHTQSIINGNLVFFCWVLPAS